MSQPNPESGPETLKQPSRLVNGMLFIGVVLLLGIAVLLSGGGRAIAGQLAQRQAATSYEAGDPSCPPCEEARRAKIEEMQTEKDSNLDATSDANSESQSNIGED